MKIMLKDVFLSCSVFNGLDFHHLFLFSLTFSSTSILLSTLSTLDGLKYYLLNARPCKTCLEKTCLNKTVSVFNKSYMTVINFKGQFSFLYSSFFLHCTASTAGSKHSVLYQALMTVEEKTLFLLAYYHDLWSILQIFIRQQNKHTNV